MNKTRTAGLAIALVAMLMATTLIGTAAAASQSGTYYFSESGLPSGQTWSVNIYDTSYGSLLTTLSGTGTLSWSNTNAGDILAAYAPNVQKPESVPGGSYTTTFSSNHATLSHGEQLNSVGTYSFTFDNTLKYSWSSSGLPSGTTFGVTYQDTLSGSYANTLTGSQTYSNVNIGSSPTSPSEPVGAGLNFAYTIQSPTGYSASPSSGSFSTTGSASIAFSLITYTDTFQESGLPSGTSWGVQLSNGQTYSSTTGTLSVNFNINTQYTYTIQGGSGYTITSGSTGTLKSGTTSVTYAQVPYTDVFSETGLKSGTQWGVYGNGSWHYSTSNSISVGYTVTSPQNYTVKTVTGYGTPSPQTGTLTSGNTAVTYTPTTYFMIFNSTGLVGSVSWTVSAHSNAYTTTNGTVWVPFTLINQGTYSISKPSGYILNSASSGSLSNTTVTVSFSQIRGILTYTETGLPAGKTWGVTANGQTKTSSTGLPIQFNESEGYVQYSASQYDSQWYSPYFQGQTNVSGKPSYVFPLSISGSPSGSGTYDQQFTLNTQNAPGIVSGLNSKASNFQVTYANGTPAYTWIQSHNSTSITFWSKLYNGTSSVSVEIFPQFENLLSSTGYLGYSTSDFNAPSVFPHAYDFVNATSLPDALSVSGALNLTGSNLTLANSELLTTSYDTFFPFYAFAQTSVFSGGNNPTFQMNHGVTYQSYALVATTTYEYRIYQLDGYPTAGGNFVSFGNYSTPVQWSIWAANNSASSFASEINNYGVSTGINSYANVPAPYAMGGPQSIDYLIFASTNYAQMPTYTVGSQVYVTGNATYNINFNQYRTSAQFTSSGLNGGDTFWVKAGSQNVTGTSPGAATITQANNTSLSYTYGSLATGWFTPTSKGTTLPFTGNTTVTVGLSQFTFTVTFRIEGYNGTWSIYLGSKQYTSNTNTILITLSAGSYSFQVGAPGSHVFNPSAWNGFVNSNMTITIQAKNGSAVSPGIQLAGSYIFVYIIMGIAVVAFLGIIIARRRQ